MKWQTVVMLIGLAVACGVCAERLNAQQTPPGPLIHMVVSVESHHGGEVPVINREDVVVSEGHDKDKVAAWVPASGENAGLDLYVLLDDSSSWTVGTQLDEVRTFIMQQPASTFVAVGYMHNGTVQTVQGLTTEHASAARAVRVTEGNSSGAASPYFSLQDLIKHWPPDSTRPRREVVMLTNGIDLYSSGSTDPYLDEALEQVQRAGILVYSIYMPGTGHAGHSLWRVNWGQDNLSRISDETGAESYGLGVVGAASFKPYFDDISKRLAHQYLLTFLAKPEKKTEMRSVKLRTEVPDAELVGPDRVYVPASPGS